MTREEKCQLAIEKGYTYNPETGQIIGVHGKEIKSKDVKGYIIISLKLNNKQFLLKGHQFAWYIINKECVLCLDHINRIKHDNRLINLRSVTNKENTKNSILPLINKQNGITKSLKTNNEINDIIENWNFYSNGKITQKKISIILNKSLRLVKYQWFNHKKNIKELNNKFKNK